MGFPIGHLLSIRSFVLAGADACQLFEANCKRSKETNLIFIAWISSAEHFNSKRYLTEREVIWEIMIFNLNLYENGEQNTQF